MKTQLAGQRHYRRIVLPYGCWTCADGREVLFNRSYVPIWQRLDGVVRAADPSEWVRWTSQRRFYTDEDTQNPNDLCRHLEMVLTKFQHGHNVSAMLKRTAA